MKWMKIKCHWGTIQIQADQNQEKPAQCTQDIEYLKLGWIKHETSTKETKPVKEKMI